MKLPKFTKPSALVASPTTRLGFAYFALAITLTGLVYLEGLVVLRHSAFDPQIQLAEDVAAALDSGQAPVELVAHRDVDMRRSIAPFLTVTDEKLNVLTTTGKLDGATALPPAGAFAAAASAANHENRVTWQPAKDVRQAAVIVAHKGGYVMASRNLREIEVRESNLAYLATAALIALLMFGLLLVLVIK